MFQRERYLNVMYCNVLRNLCNLLEKIPLFDERHNFDLIFFTHSSTIYTFVIIVEFIVRPK
jgi:hypothetical protein